MAAAGNSEEQAQAQGCTNKMMMWLMPIFSVYICATGNAAFALYWFVSSLYAFGQMRVVDLIKKEESKEAGSNYLVVRGIYRGICRGKGKNS